MNVSALADPVQTADALFQQIWMERQVEANQVLCKLKIAALTANLEQISAWAPPLSSAK